jgi:hypothetical protein
MASALALVLTAAVSAQAADYYVSANRGKGRKGTKEKPVKNIGNLLKKLQPGDTIHIAGGEYQGKSDAGWVEINIPVNIIGGYNDDFSARDPWGAHRTVLVGTNKSENYKNAIRLRINLDTWNRDKRLEFVRAKQNTEYPIVIDGLIIDNAGRNRYKSEQQNLILRKANPATGDNPTPDGPGLAVGSSIYSPITVQNCVVINCGPTQGALSVTVARGGSATIRNNLIVNNTGVGLFARTSHHPGDDTDVARFTITNNTVLFTEKYDAYGGIGGYAFQLDAAVKADVQHNVFAYSDQCGVYNPSKSSVKELTLAYNLVYGSLVADMIEFDTKMPVDTWEDDSDEISDDSEENVGTEISVPVTPEWLGKYFARAIIDRNAAEADVQAADSKVNELRKILGLPQQAPDMNLDSDVWLPRISLEEALRAGESKYAGEYGCQKPQ